MNPADDRPLHALNRVLQSIQAVRNGPALYLLLATFALGGLLLAMAQSSLVKGAQMWGVLQAGLAFTATFYGSNATGLAVMDEARGRPVRGVGQALRDALMSAHRLLLVLCAVGLLGVLALALLLALLWLCRLPMLGVWLFGLVVPFGVVWVGGVMMAAVAVVGPLAAPATWRGMGVRDTLAFLRRQIRRRLLFAALLHGAASLLAAAVGALASFVVIAGGRTVALLAVLVLQVDLPPQQLMGGLFGLGLRSLGAVGAPAAHNAYGMAALVGGGVVFALALVLPGVVYLRGLCAVFLALDEADALRDGKRPSWI